LRELAGGGLSVSCTADFWDGDDQDTNSLGADVSYEVDKSWKTSVGTYYSLYKYELLELAERDDVRTYYIRAGRALSSRLDFDVSYELENDDLDTYHTLRLGILWRF
jgi:outer membrane protein assembly factor BamA